MHSLDLDAPAIRRARHSFSLPLDLPPGVWLVLCAYAAILAGVAWAVPFPTRIDELPHYSVIRAQFEHPAIFPDWSGYFILDPADPGRWSTTHNFINHPSLYYLALAPLFAIGGDPLLMRMANVLLSLSALLILMVTVRRRVAPDVVAPGWFLLAAISFPKAAVVGGLVNNDNLAGLAAALLFAGVMGMPGAGWWIMAALALAGWTKLTALIALGAVAGAWLAMRGWQARARWSLRDPLIISTVVGGAIGAIPYLVTLARTGHLLWVNAAIWYVPPAQRPPFGFIDFASYFGRALLYKWPAAEGAFPLSLVFAMLVSGAVLVSLGARACGRRAPGLRSVVLAYVAGIGVLFAVHLGFGWRSFVTLGDLTIAQTRYYSILWPGVALALGAGLTRLARGHRLAAWAAFVPVALMTIAGSALLAIL